MNSPHIYNFFPDDFFEYSDTAKEIFHCSIAGICGKFPQEALVIDENQTWWNWKENLEIVDKPRIYGFDYATDPRASESVGFYAYQANGLAYGSEDLKCFYNIAGGGTYINHFQQLSVYLSKMVTFARAQGYCVIYLKLFDWVIT